MLYNPALSAVAASPNEGLGAHELRALHVMLNRVYSGSLNWVVAFGAAGPISATVKYALYVDADHIAGSGATSDELGQPLAVHSLYLPDYLLYVDRIGDAVTPNQVRLHTWNGSSWSPPQKLDSIGGDAWYAPDTQAVQLLISYTAI